MPNIVKNTTIIGLLDLLAPHSCRGCGQLGSALCNRCKKNILKSQHNICPNCKAKNPTGNCPDCPLLPPTYIGGERSGLLGELVHDYKYHSIRALAGPLAEIMYHSLPNDLQQAYIIPLPTINRHVRERGFDHTLLIAKHLSKLTGYRVLPILNRSKSTVQVGTDRTTRLSQVKDAYILDSNKLDPGATYILFDDVWTTGASMGECVKKLRQAGAKNIIIALLSLSRID